jgi:hypothetical protein
VEKPPQDDAKVSVLIKQMAEESGEPSKSDVKEEYSKVSKSTATATLRRVNIIERKVIKENDGWRAHVLMSLPEDGINNATIDNIKQNKDLDLRLRSSKLFQELDEQSRK